MEETAVDAVVNNQVLTILEIVAIVLGAASMVFAVRGHMKRLTDALVDLRAAVTGLTGRLDRYDSRLSRHHDRLRDLEWKTGVRRGSGGPVADDDE